MKAPGRFLISFSSVIYLILGILIAVAAAIVLIVDPVQLANVLADVLPGGAPSFLSIGKAMLGLILSAIAVVLLVISIVGLRSGRKPSKGTASIVLGILLVLLQLAALFIGYRTAILRVNAGSVLSGVVMLLLSLFFIIGGALNRMAAPKTA